MIWIVDVYERTKWRTGQPPFFFSFCSSGRYRIPRKLLQEFTIIDHRKIKKKFRKKRCQNSVKTMKDIYYCSQNECIFHYKRTSIEREMKREASVSRSFLLVYILKKKEGSRERERVSPAIIRYTEIWYRKSCHGLSLGFGVDVLKFLNFLGQFIPAKKEYSGFFFFFFGLVWCI